MKENYDKDENEKEEEDKDDDDEEEVGRAPTTLAFKLDK